MTKFLNISTDTTLGGNSASDDTVSSQKAVKAYVDSQTGTAPAFANITGQPTDNANLATALAGKVPTSRTINSKALTSDITLTASDVGALPDSTVIPTVNNATLTIQKNGTTVNTFTANASSNVIANITVPTKTSDLTNDDGFITGITSSDVTTALGYTPYNSSNPAGYTSNVGTVTSVNNVSPVSGNVTLSIPTVNNATLTITQGGTTKGTFTANASSNVTIDLDSGGTVDVDNSTITLNSSDQIQTVAVKDNNNNAIKTWTGTRQQYDSITTKDSNTLYNITDDTDVTLTLLNTLYPVGAIYIGTMNACPLQVLGVGTWSLVSSGRVLQGVSSGQTTGTTVEAGLPNITGWFNSGGVDRGYTATGAFISSGKRYNGANGNDNYSEAFDFDASRSSSIYGNSDTVQPPAYLVNIWERTA